MAVAVDTGAVANTNGNLVGSLTFAVTITAAGIKRAIVVGTGFNPTASNFIVSNVTYAGKQGTLVKAIANSTTQRAEAWVVTNPAEGANNVVVTYSGSVDAVAGAVGFTGVDQITPISYSTSATGASNPSLVIQSAVGEITMDVMGDAGTPSAPTQTSRWLNTAPTSISGTASTGTGAVTVTHTWTLSSAYAQVGLSVRPALMPNNYQFVTVPDGMSTTERIR